MTGEALLFRGWKITRLRRDMGSRISGESQIAIRRHW